jgi:hypothetical protein
VFKALPQPDSAELGKRAYRFGQAAPHKFDACDKGRADSASNTRYENSKLAFRRRDLLALFQIPGFQHIPSISSSSSEQGAGSKEQKLPASRFSLLAARFTIFPGPAKPF